MIPEVTAENGTKRSSLLAASRRASSAPAAASSLRLEAPLAPGSAGREVLSAEALGFVGRLLREFEPRRVALLRQRKERQAAIDAGRLDPQRLKRFRKLLSEDRRNSETIAERRARDRTTGALYKSILEEKQQLKGVKK